MKYIALIALLTLASCTGVVTSRTFTQLKPGMSQEVSIQKLGKANIVIQKDGMELHKYTNVFGPSSYTPAATNVQR